MRKRIHFGVLISLLALLALQSYEATAQELPKVRVVSVRRVFYNAQHNAFTDLIRFKGRYYLAFRSCPDGHGIHSSSSIIILGSDDTRTWQQVHRFSVRTRDTRDPHFLIFKDKLFVYTGTWFCGDEKYKPQKYDINEHLGYAVWSADGEKWHGPEMLEGTYGHYVWRAATFGDKAYLCGRRKHEFAWTPNRKDAAKITESAMLESDDGLIWKKVALFQEHNGDETAFLFEPDGRVVAVARRGGNNAELCTSAPPYRQWQRKDLGQYIGGPLLVKWNDYYLVGGRKRENDRYRTALFWLVDGKLHEFAVLPSDGDNSYPGFVRLSPTKALISYYSSHEKDDTGKPITAIYLAELEIMP